MATRARRTQERPLFLSLLSATLLFLLPAISAVDSQSSTDFIRTSCATTLYPELCYTSLSRYASIVQQSPGKLASIAVKVSLSKARKVTSYLSNLSVKSGSGVEAALHDCITTFSDANDQIQRSLAEMRDLSINKSFRFRMSNVQTWMSAVLTNEYTCTDGFDEVPDGPTKSDVYARTENVKKLTSNALALVNSFVAGVIGNS